MAISDGRDMMLDRKIARTRRRLFFERMWPRVWFILGPVLIFLGLSFFDVWPMLPVLAHQIVLGALGLAGVAGLVAVLRTDYPTRPEAIRHLEGSSDVEHRPATTADDTLNAQASDDPTAQAIWAEHQRRMAERAKSLRVAPAKPRTDRFDPIALRAAAVLLVALGAGLAGQTIPDRVKAAFDFGQTAQLAARARLDAWITPPGYTSRPAIILANGGQRSAQTRIEAPGLTDALVTAPENSVVTVRTSGNAAGALGIKLLDAKGRVLFDSIEAAKAEAEEKPRLATARRADADANGTKVQDLAQSDEKQPSKELGKSGPAPQQSGDGDTARAIQSASGKLSRNVTKIVAYLGSTQARVWDVKITPDNAPTIAQTKPHEATRRGAMKLYYQVQDDYGVASAEARIVALPPDEEDPRTQWARPDALKGPKLPHARPPQITLRLPGRRSKDGKTWSFHDIGSHPWAGMRVRMTLVAKDHAGNVGTSKPIDMRLPQRRFRRQLAKAVIEQRRNLVIDDRYVPIVRRALDAIVLEPEGFIKDLGVYAGLRSAYHRLNRPQSRPSLDETIKHLWHIAVRIEDGKGLSGAERRLRELQEQLSKAIQNNASDEEIRRLMQELRQALAEFMRQLAEQGQRSPQQQQQGQNQQQQFLSQRDLEQMMRNLENMARQGSKDQAQEMLSQLRDL
ncbi:MAG: TIGR02302 family protein, partial [Pseudomonadota bacterium]